VSEIYLDEKQDSWFFEAENQEAKLQKQQSSIAMQQVQSSCSFPNRVKQTRSAKRSGAPI
jgi:hypothetical protein